MVRRHSSPACRFHTAWAGGRSSPGTAGGRAGSSSSWRSKQASGTPCGQCSRSRRGRHGRVRPARSVRWVWTGPKRGCGEGEEHARVLGDRGGDAFAADQAGGDELVGVGAVGLRAGRADGGAAVAARVVDHPVGHLGGVPSRVIRPVAASTWVTCRPGGSGASSRRRRRRGPATRVVVADCGELVECTGGFASRAGAELSTVSDRATRALVVVIAVPAGVHVASWLAR